MKKYGLLAILLVFGMVLCGFVGCSDPSKESAGNKKPSVGSGDNYAPDIFDDLE